jgi:release factor glutamine methyltransferase
MTIGESLRAATAALAEAGIDSARLDAKLLLGDVLGRDAAWLFNHGDEPLSEQSETAFAALIERRRERQPISLILGRREFWSLDFTVTRDTLAPRPDSETVIEAVLAELPDRGRPLSLLDLGTGTGCLLLALLSELPAARGTAVDIDPRTLAVAKGNAERLGLDGRASFVQSDWWERIEGRFDVILSNPPYIKSDDIAGLDPEVARFEPLGALDGGADGLDAYRHLASRAGEFLTEDGMIALEVGAGQAPDVAALLAQAGFASCAVRRDLAGIERCVLARRR